MKSSLPLATRLDMLPLSRAGMSTGLTIATALMLPTLVGISTAIGITPAMGHPAAGETSVKNESLSDPVHLAGASIFSAQCANCHGAMGEGNEDFYPDPLIGDASIGELTKIIVETMPEEDPDLCVGKDAEAVAAYIHHQFYSEAAQIRNRPPRQMLQRLTGDQLQQSLSNLYAAFASVHRDTWKERKEQHGLEARYYTGKEWKDEHLKIKRTDPVLDFDFGMDGPKKVDGSDSGVDGESFHAHWKGGVRIEQSGRYEIIVRSTTSFECFFGHDKNQLIDNHVQSEGRNEFRRTMMLTGGRIYPIRIDMNQRKRKGETPPSSMSLSWVPPGGVEEILPARHLVPGWVPSTLRLSTRMPPDDSTYGFQRGISVDATWAGAVTESVLEFADQACEELWPDYQNRFKKEKLGREELMRRFLGELIAVAHHGTSDQVDADSIMKVAQATHEDETEQIRYAILRTLKSPRFLYPTIDSDRSASWRAGVRISLALHDALPGDRWLIDKMNDGQLETEEQRRSIANKLVDDARTRSKVREMLYYWLEIRTDDDLRKDEQRFPGFDAAVVSDLRQSLDLFLDQTVWDDPSDPSQLVAADWTLTTPRLAEFYGDAWKPADSGAEDGQSASGLGDGRFSRSVAAPGTHVGVLTHPLVMAKFAHHQSSSPIHRGVFLIRHVMGRTLRPPNAAFAPLSPDLHPDLTTRQRVELQTSPESCQICHVKINPLGFALEHFDAVGRYRELENSRPIDAAGSYMTRDDREVRFETARQLGDYVASSTDAQSAFVDRVFQYIVKQPIAAYAPERIQQLKEQTRLRDLLVEIAVLSCEE